MSGGWRDRALCLGMSPDLWFPETGPAPRARRICAVCPVRAECLAFALATGAEFGIWGGLNVEERQALGVARTRPCKRCGEPAPLPARYCGEECRRAARRKVQADSQRRRAAA